MSATDELRRLLDERGVEYYDGTESTLWGYERTSEFTGAYHFAADEISGGRMQLRMFNVTPEQAIEATLWRGTCRNISPKLGNDEFTCEECLARVYGSGGQWFDANWKYHKFNYCPNCGRKVVE